MRIANLCILLTATLMLSTAGAEPADDGYRLGGGYLLGETGVRVGGYTNLKIDSPRSGDWQFRAHDLSLFLSWDNGARLRFFSELEGGDVLTAGEYQSLNADNGHFEFERFYFDTLINDNLTVRLGKFLTPVGQWNLIHAAPLVWTSNRPVASENLFSTHASGIMLHGATTVAERRLEYAVYGDLSNDLDPHLSDNPFNDAAGGHLRYALDDNLQIGASFAHYALKDIPSQRHYLAGLDVDWSYRRFELSSEIVYRASEHNNSKSLWQGFVQSVNPVTPHWFVIGRYEFFEQAWDKTGQVGLLGLAYRPLPPLVWKLEYRMGAHNEALAPEGLSASFAILF